MTSRAPHYLLFSEAGRPVNARASDDRRWRFVLQSVEGGSRFEAHDCEEEMPDDRLELLAVVRGLEALDQPSRVTLVTPSKYVSRGLRYGLEQWRENRWRWEHHGRMVAIKNDDLWQRLDETMKYHRVECRTWRLDPAHSDLNRSRSATTQRGDSASTERPPPVSMLVRAARRAGQWIGRWLRFERMPAARTAA
jgi:ribonuclease HI